MFEPSSMAPNINLISDNRYGDEIDERSGKALGQVSSSESTCDRRS